MPRVVRLLIAGRAVNRAGAFSLTFLVLILTEEHGWTAHAAGLVMAGFGLATIPSRLLGGRWADRLGRRTTIVIGLLGCACAQLGVAVSTSTWEVVASVIALGVCYEIYEPASQAIVADHVGGPEQLRAHAAMAAALAVAGAFAGGLASVLASVDLRWLFVADAISCIVAALVLGSGLPRDAAPLLRPSVDGARTSSMSPWRDRRLLRLVGVQTVFAVVYLQTTVALPLTVQARALGAWVLGGVLLVAASTMVLAQPLLGTAVVRSWSTSRRIAVGFGVTAIGLTGYAVADTPWTLLGATVVTALGDLVLIGQLLTLGATLAPEHLRARYLAVLGTSWGFAAVMAPLVGTALLTAAGPATCWAVLAGVCLLLAASSPRWVTSAGRAQEGASSVAACEASPPTKHLPAREPSRSTATTSPST